jgi:CheY-like chemotaxis protein
LGTDVLGHIKSMPRLAHTKTVVVTANTQAESHVDALGADLFLLKPVSIVEMLTLANRLLGKPAS